MYVGGANSGKWKMEKCIFYQVHFSGSSILANTFLPLTLFCNFYFQFTFWASPCYNKGGGKVKPITFCGIKRKRRLEIYFQKINKFASVLKTKTDKSQHFQRVLHSNELCIHHQLKVECLKENNVKEEI